MERGGKFLILTFGISFIGLAILIATVFLAVPQKTDGSLDYLGLLFFYTGLFLFVFGMFAGIFFKLRLKRKGDLYLKAKRSFRQGMLLGVFVCLLFLLQSLRMLIWWDASLLLLAVILVDMWLAVR